MTPDLSVIIPTFNRGRTLQKVLAALEIHHEELHDAEVIVVDDGSSDGTGELVRPYLEKGTLELRYIFRENGGAAVARNRGIRAAKGRVLLLLDCDIIPSTELIREHRRFHEQFPGPEWALRGSVVAANSSRETVRKVEFHHVGGDGEPVLLPWHAFRSGNISLKRGFLLQHGLFDPELKTQEDTELGYRLGKRGLKLFHSDAAVGFHDHPMDVTEYWRYANIYGRSMAIWCAKYPELVSDLTSAGIEYRYGFISWRSSPGRMLKCCLKAALANRLTIQAISRLGQALRAKQPKWSDQLNRLGYYYHFKRSFREHQRLIRQGKLTVRRPLRVCMLASLLPPEYSGAARQAVTLARGLQQRGDAVVSLLSYTLKRELSGAGMFERMPAYRIYTPSFGLVRKALLSLRLAFHLVRLRRTYDVLHIHGGVFLIGCPTLIGKLLGKKTVLKMTTWGEDDAQTLKTCRFAWLKYPLFLMASRYVATSSQFREGYLQCGLDSGKLSVIPNAVDVERFHPSDFEERRRLRAKLGLSDGGKIAITVGPIIQRKRLDILIDIWRKVVDRVPDAFLVHLGPRDQEEGLLEALEIEVRRLSLEKSVAFLGLRENPEDYLRAADVFLFASEREGSPNAVVEAMASGLPCVVFRLPGITDDLLTHLENGVVVDPDDEEVFARQTITVLSELSFRGQLGAAARQKIMVGWQLSVVGDQYAQLYHALFEDQMDKVSGMPARLQEVVVLPNSASHLLETARH